MNEHLIIFSSSPSYFTILLSYFTILYYAEARTHDFRFHFLNIGERNSGGDLTLWGVPTTVQNSVAQNVGGPTH
jgi:hypothetical protein